MLGAAGVVVAGSTGPSGDPTGMLLAAGNVVLYALFFVGSKLALPHVDTVPFLFGNMIAAATTVSVFVAITGTAVTPLGASDLLRCIIVAVVSGAAGHFSVTAALRHVPANLPPVIMLSIPVISGALAWATLGQDIRGVQVIAGVVTLAAVAGAVRSPTAREIGADEALALSEET
jgi:drug/metabolite transporter (DMT)-like permease